MVVYVAIFKLIIYQNPSINSQLYNIFSTILKNCLSIWSFTKNQHHTAHNYIGFYCITHLKINIITIRVKVHHELQTATAECVGLVTSQYGRMLTDLNSVPL